MKSYGGGALYLHSFLISALAGDSCPLNHTAIFFQYNAGCVSELVWTLCRIDAADEAVSSFQTLEADYHWAQRLIPYEWKHYMKS
jgi:hypothetical protein